MKSRDAFAVVWLIFLVAAIYRTIDFYLTGFFVPDEYAYLYFHLGQFDYQGRFFFNTVNYLWFGWLPSTDSKLVMLPLYLIFWFSIGLYAAWQTVKELVNDERTQTIALLIGASIPVYLLFSDGVITEAVAFPTAMFGIWLMVRFHRTHDWWLALPSALFFAAAAYTHLDFVLLLLMGWVMFLKSPKALLAFIVPAAFFLLWPVDVMGVGPLFASHGHDISNGVIGGIAGVGIPNSGPAGSGPGAPGSARSTLPYAAYLFLTGSLGGFGPVPLVLALVGFAFLLRNWKGYFAILAVLAVAAFAGTAYIYSGAITVYLGTMVRYSFDLLPAYFIMAPFAISRLRSKRAFELVGIGLIGWGLLGVVFAAPVFGQNLASTYPFIGSNDQYLSPSYRTPMVEMRDWFMAHPQSQYLVLAQDPLSLDGNVSNLWHFTPGTSGLNVTFLPYSYGVSHAGTFYLYAPTDLNVSLKATVRSFVIVPQSTVVLIAGNDGYSLTQVTLA